MVENDDTGMLRAPNYMGGETDKDGLRPATEVYPSGMRKAHSEKRKRGGTTVPQKRKLS